MTSRALSQTLSRRFGPDIARSVMAASMLDGRTDDPVDVDRVEQAIAMALEAEVVAAGDAFIENACISALANSTAFQRAALQAGVPADRIGPQQRLHIDAAFARRWRALKTGHGPASDLESAQALMAAVLLDEAA